MTPPRHFGTACVIEDFDPGGLSPRQIDPGMGFSWILLQRHGKRPVGVCGRTLLQANNRCAGLPLWSEISIHETLACRFAAAMRHASMEADAAAFSWCDAQLCDSPEAVRAWFYGHNPVVALSPYPMPRCDPRGLVDIDGFVSVMSRHAAVAERFRGAWSGLLAAVLGLPVAHPAAA